jgi:hypothetical protein
MTKRARQLMAGSAVVLMSALGFGGCAGCFNHGDNCENVPSALSEQLCETT